MHQFDIFSPHDVQEYALCDEENAVQHRSRKSAVDQSLLSGIGRKHRGKGDAFATIYLPYGKFDMLLRNVICSLHERDIFC